ncbi:MAG: hypothetical protein HPY81_09485 [Firmicutes bacterium]|nr:hypothetical protein [Bacillota bacterium]
MLIDLKIPDNLQVNEQQTGWDKRSIIAAIFGALGTASLILLALITPPFRAKENDENF